MIQRIRISVPQLACLTGLFLFAAVLIFIPTPMARVAGPDAWLAPIVSALGGGIPIALSLGLVSRCYPGKSLGEAAELALGAWIGKVTCLFLAGHALFLGSLVVRDMMDFNAVTVLRGTPRAASGILFLLVAAYMAYCGAETIARMAPYPLSMLTGTLLLMPVGLTRQLNPLLLQPVLGRGLWPVLQAAWPALGWFGELLVIGQWIGMIDRPRRTFAGLVAGVGLSLSLLVPLVAITLMVFGASQVKKFMLPSYYLVNLVSYGQVFERVEVLLIMFWVTGMLVKAAACLWAGSSLLARILRIKVEHRTLLFTVPLVFGLTFIWPSFISVVRFSTELWTPIMLPLELGLPALVAAAAWLRTRRESRANRGASA